MKNLKITMMTIGMLTFGGEAFSQSLGINTSGASADPSSILDLSSTSKGLLIPRMTAAQRAAIGSPATGLLVYQTDETPGFYFNSGTPSVPSWKLTATSENSTYTAGTGISISSNAISLVNTTVSAGSYGSATQVGTFTVDAQGRLTAASNTTISGVAPGGNAGGDLSGTYPNPTIAAGAVTNADLANMAALSVKGNATNASAVPTDIAAANDNEVLRRSGTAIGFGAVNLASSSAVTGTLPVGNGGTGQSSYTDGQLLIGNTTGNTLTKSTLTAGTGITITNGAGSITIANTDTPNTGSGTSPRVAYWSGTNALTSDASVTINPNTTTTTLGSLAVTTSSTTDATKAIYASATGVTGTTSAVAGINASTTSGSSGVYGEMTSSTSAGNGVFGKVASSSVNSAGVFGSATNGVGVWGSTTGASGFAGYFNATNGGYAAIFNNGNVGIGTLTPGSKLDVKGTLRLSGSTSGYVGFAPAAEAGSTTYILPAADGTSGQVLSTNGSGTLSWSNSVPRGGIIMWSGTIATIPSGWALCDGSTVSGLVTPDLRERFIVGSGSTDNTTVAGTTFTDYAPGNTGGANTVTIAEANLPSHTHSIGGNTSSGGGSHTHGVGTLATSQTGAHTHTHGRRVSGNASTGGTNTNWGNEGTGTTSSAGDHTHTISGSTASTDISHTHPLPAATGATGGGTAINIRPPFYALAFIIKL